MKRVYNSLIFTLLTICLIPFGGVLHAQESTDTTVVPPVSRLALSYLCSSDDSVTLTATLTSKRDMVIKNLENATVTFFVLDGTTSKEVGHAITNQEGNAVIKISDKGLAADKEGMIRYIARFAGVGEFPEAESDEFAAKPAKIRLFFSIEDSVRTLRVTVTQRDAKGLEVPVPGETVIIGVPRLFSLLKIGEITLDETGTGTVEFPKQIVGDNLGNLIVAARIEEHEKFGFVQGQNLINWGVPKHYYTAEVPSRELWTPVAPLWMIITLLIMLVGVWAHYIYAIYELVMIKRLNRKQPPPLT